MVQYPERLVPQGFYCTGTDGAVLVQWCSDVTVEWSKL